MTKSAAFSLADSGHGQKGTNESIPVNRKPVEQRAKLRDSPSKVKYRRRTIELHPDMENMLDALQIELRMRSQTEVMQKAIQLLAYIMGEEDGKRKKLYVEKDNGNLRELIIL